MNIPVQNKNLFELDHQLRNTYNIKLSYCKYFKGEEYIKVLYDDFVYIYNIKLNHITKVHDTRYNKIKRSK